MWDGMERKLVGNHGPNNFPSARYMHTDVGNSSIESETAPTTFIGASRLVPLATLLEPFLFPIAVVLLYIISGPQKAPPTDETLSKLPTIKTKS